MSTRTVMIIDGICLTLFVLMGIYIFALPTAVQDMLMPAFIVINPFQTGAWIMGIGFLVTCGICTRFLLLQAVPFCFTGA